MKKVFAVLAVICVSSLLLMSCTTLKSNYDYDVQIQSELESGLVTLNVEPQWGAYYFTQGISGFSVQIENNTEKIVKIVWELSSISYGGSSYTLFIEGQKYIDSEVPMAPTVIAGNGLIEKSIFSSAQPKYSSGSYGGWSMRVLDPSDITIILCVQSGDIEDFYTITVQPREIIE